MLILNLALGAFILGGGAILAINEFAEFES